MENMVDYGLSPSVLKPFVLCSLLNKDFALAQKYNDVLLSTLFYRDWAIEHQKYIDHPETINNAPEFKNILPLNTYSDMLNGDFGDMEVFLRNHFTHMGEVPKELSELEALFTLEAKDSGLFWPSLFQWVSLNRDEKSIPVHFQEAALLFERLEHKVDLTHAPFDEAVRVNFNNYMDMIQQYGNYPEESIKQMSYNLYGNTYWHYYFFVNVPQTQVIDDKKYKK